MNNSTWKLCGETSEGFADCARLIGVKERTLRAFLSSGRNQALHAFLRAKGALVTIRLDPLGRVQESIH